MKWVSSNCNTYATSVSSLKSVLDVLDIYFFFFFSFHGRGYVHECHWYCVYFWIKLNESNSTMTQTYLYFSLYNLKLSECDWMIRLPDSTANGRCVVCWNRDSWLIYLFTYRWYSWISIWASEYKTWTVMIGQRHLHCM